jgi:hypothetical protein
MRRMKLSVFLVMLVIGQFVCGPVSAQQERDMIEILRAQISADRQALVAVNMELSEKQGENFWPLYREYHLERDALMDRRLKILTEFRDDYMGMTAKQAEQILVDSLKLEKDILKLKESYRKRFQKVLAPRATLRYYQIENKFDAVIHYDIAAVVPLR